VLMAQKVDQLWQEHLLTMDHLRSEVSLRTVAQRDPLLEFKHEAFRIFHEMSRRLHTETARNLFKIEITVMHPGLFQELLKQISLETNRMIFDNMPQEVPEGEKASPPPPTQPIAAVPVSATPKIGRNDACPCNSGKKYKKCCGIAEEPA
jgi:preprotein translocase subunit SecA